MRGIVWPKFLDADIKRERRDGEYQNSLGQLCAEHETVQKDLHRTYPQNVYFRSDEEGLSAGRAALSRVLNAYGVFDTQTGYTQGMGFVAGMFLMYMDEKTSFWMLESLTQDLQLSGLWSDNFPMLHELIYVTKHVFEEQAKKLCAHLATQGLPFEIYLHKWFMTLFAYELPFKVVLRIWDIMFFDRSVKILFQLCIFVMKQLASKLLEMDLEGMNGTLQNISEEEMFQDADMVVERVTAIKLSDATVENLRRDYHSSLGR